MRASGDCRMFKLVRTCKAKGGTDNGVYHSNAPAPFKQQSDGAVWRCAAMKRPTTISYGTLDYHVGSRDIITASGERKRPQLLGMIDDHSRLICHMQWYLDQSAYSLVHGFSQALQKRCLPRALMSQITAVR